MADAKRSNVTYISDFLAKRNTSKVPDVLDLSFLLQDDAFVFLPIEPSVERIDTVVPTVSFSFSDDDVFIFVTDDVRK